MNEKKAREHLSKYDKETIIDLYLQKCYELDIAKKELDKAIVPRFNFNSIVSYISDKTGIVVSDNTIDKIKIVATKERFYSNIKIKYKLTYNTKYFDEDELFATKEEARAKLKELQNK